MNQQQNMVGNIFDYVILIFFMSLFLCFFIFSLWFIFIILKNRKTKVSNLKVIQDEENSEVLVESVELPEQKIRIIYDILVFINHDKYGNRIHSTPL